jgi:HD-like signal output (HDOD) protein/ActR/RegA family two-component response regulator
VRSILFVDDEPNILEGLQRMLRPMRSEWDMRFAESGRSALDSMADQPCDVVVTDMRMPGMDGSQLLTEVRRLYPGTVRIVLSGQSDREMIMKTVGPAHQYLSKPCEAEVLKDTVSRACALRDLLTHPQLKLLVSEMDSLPSLSASCTALLEEFDSPEVSIKRVGQIISRDPGMTAKMLQLVNSAFFGLRRHVASAEEAVSLLGLDITRALVLSAEIFIEFKAPEISGLSLDALWAHSFAVAELAKRIARSAGATLSIADLAFTAGLLHEVGRLVLASRMAPKYSEAMEIAATEQISITAAEERVFGTAHPEIGAYLLGLWGLPDEIVEAVAFHRRPAASAVSQFDALVAVHIADYLDSTQAGGDMTSFDSELLDRLGVSYQMARWEELYRESRRHKGE